MSPCMSSFLLKLVEIVSLIKGATALRSCKYSFYSQYYYYTCFDNQYCCHYDSCCTHGYSLWYVWFLVSIFIVIIASIALAYKKKKLAQRRRVNVVTQQVQRSHTMALSLNKQTTMTTKGSVLPPPYTPPSYQEVMNDRNYTQTTTVNTVSSGMPLQVHHPMPIHNSNEYRM
ncbi:uncharacterized protein [Antedon mediterranea]|uniref:uncharacterized protein n=1 Tax=Antedon mediterranea TaxID=105859 RepID=UPI003AF5DF58